MRLIDADVMIEYLRKLLCDNCSEKEDWCDVCDYGYLIDEMKKVPTVDPIKHGHWISIDDDGDAPYKCSVCGGVKVNESGEWLDICHQEWSKMPYCVVCGAKMDEVEE